MSDPADGEDPRDTHGPGEASDEDVRAAMSDVEADPGQEPREPRDTVPEGYADDPAGDDPTTDERDPADGAASATGADAGEGDGENRADGDEEDHADGDEEDHADGDEMPDAGDGDEGDRVAGADTDGGTDPAPDAPAKADEGARDDGDPGLREEDLSAPASAADGDHTLLEEYEREQEPAWKSYARTGAFWLGATAGSVALTTTAFVSLVESGLSQAVAFFIASVALAVVVGFVFLSLQRE